MSTLSIYQLRRSVQDATGALAEFRPSVFDVHDLRLRGSYAPATLFLATHTASVPPWVTWLGLDGEVPDDFGGSSLSGVLVVKVGGWFFALTFNRGHVYLDRSAVVARFGLRAAATLIESAGIGICDSRGLREARIASARTSARGAGPGEWNLEEGTELVTKLGGVPKRFDDAEWKGVRPWEIAGADHARVGGDFEPEDLPRLCRDLLRASWRRDYREELPQLDMVRQLGRGEVAEAEDAVASLISEGRVQALALHPPDLSSEGATIAVDGVRRQLSRFGLVTRDLLEHVLDQATSTTDPVAALKRYRVTAFDDEGVELDHWSAWKCLTGVVARGSDELVLDGGSFYRVSRDLIKRVDEWIDAFVSPSGFVWPAGAQGESEGKYLARLSMPGVHLLDKKLIRLSGQSPFEPADLWHEERAFVHAKRRSRGSQDLVICSRRHQLAVERSRKNPLNARGSWSRSSGPTSMKQPSGISVISMPLGRKLFSRSCGTSDLPRNRIPSACHYLLVLTWSGARGT